jgi:DNA replication and repair protein RecF
VDAWCKELSELCREVHFLRNLDISYYKGWPNEQNLGELTKGRKQKDREQGFTMYGPQRADILFKIDGIPIKQRLSRGQQKILIFLIMIAQAKMMVGGEGGKPVFLIDDIQSELDQKSLETVCSLLDRQENQVLVTSVTPNPLKSLPWTISPRMFHVEQGRIL